MLTIHHEFGFCLSIKYSWYHQGISEHNSSKLWILAWSSTFNENILYYFPTVPEKTNKIGVNRQSELEWIRVTC
jgi:hypothetical protein